MSDLAARIRRLELWAWGEQAPERLPRLEELGASQWQDISTAPTDYTEVIGIDANGVVARTWFFAPSSMTQNWLRSPGNKRWKPTHWMPLPPAPEVKP